VLTHAVSFDIHCRRAVCLPADASGSPQVVPIQLDEIDALSSVRIYIPKDLRQADARALGLKVLPEEHFFLSLFVSFLLLFPLSSSSSSTALCTHFCHTADSQCFVFVFLLTACGRVISGRWVSRYIPCLFLLCHLWLLAWCFSCFWNVSLPSSCTCTRQTVFDS